MKNNKESIVIVVSLFNSRITLPLLRSCLKTLSHETGLSQESFPVIEVPGAFELPSVCQKLAKQEDVACVIAIGCVIRGDTPHFDYISSEVIRGLMDVSLKTEKPVIMGVLTTNTEQQAFERCHLYSVFPGKEEKKEASQRVKPLPSDKGTEFALAALRMTQVFKGELSLEENSVKNPSSGSYSQIPLPV